MVLSFNRGVTTAGGTPIASTSGWRAPGGTAPLQHGGETPTASSGCRTIGHRTRGPQELAFEFTGRYDAHAHPTTAGAAGTGRRQALKVASYNVWAPGDRRQHRRAAGAAARSSQGYDALLLQEVFDGRREGFLQALAGVPPTRPRCSTSPGSTSTTAAW